MLKLRQTLQWWSVGFLCSLCSDSREVSLFLSFFYFLQRRCDQPRVLCGLSCRDHWWKSRLYQHWQLRWLLAWEACWIEAIFRVQKTLSWKSEWVRNIIFLASAIVEFGSSLFQNSEKLSQFWVVQVEQLHRTGLGQQLHEVPQLGSSSRGTDFCVRWGYIGYIPFPPKRDISDISNLEIHFGSGAQWEATAMSLVQLTPVLAFHVPRAPTSPLRWGSLHCVFICV